MGEYVLSVACTEVKASDGADCFLAHVVDAEVKECLFTFFVDLLLDFACNLLNDFLDAGWMNASVDDETFKSNACDFLAYRIKTRDYDCFWSIIDDDVYACKCLEGTDVAAFATDDASLHFITWK